MIAFIDSASAGSVAGASVTTAAVDMTGATLYYVNITWDSSKATPTISCASGALFIKIGDSLDGTTDQLRSAQFLAYPTAPSSSETFTATNNGGNSFASIFAMGFSGDFETPLDIDTATSNGGTSLAAGSTTVPSSQTHLIVAGLGQGSGAATGITLSGGFTVAESVQFDSGDHYGGACAYQVAGAGTYTPTWSWSTSSSTMTSFMVRIAEAAAGGGGGGEIAYGFVG